MRTGKTLLSSICAVAVAVALCPGAAFAADKTADATWDRKAGANALGTMYEITEEAFDAASCDTVVLATSGGYWDALTAAGIAGLYDCPVLLTDPYALSDETRYQIARVGASHAIITGGKSAVSYTVESTLTDEMGLSVERAQGDYASFTAIDIYSKGMAAGNWSQTAIVATAGGYWDAMSISPYAYATHSPIFLAQQGTSNDSTELDSASLDAILNGGFSRVIICGGPMAVSSNVESQLSGLEVTRLQGDTAIETSQDIANFCMREGMQPDGLAVATVDGYWDGLVGAALCGRVGAPLLLARPNDASTAVNGFVAAYKDSITHGYVLGGEAAMPAEIKSSLEQATRL